MVSDLLIFSDEVAAAQREGAPVVALESTIITHGLPYPQNLETARAVEKTVREAGAVPATIALLDGRIRIGLSDADLCLIAEAKAPQKVSRADFAATLASGRVGSTTVAATAIAACAAGIDVFATGGIGGVHKGADTSFDISADLDELARTSIVIVSAGAKAILDLPKTLEVLETRGVPVVGYRTDAFPGFWSRTTGLSAPLRVDRAGEVADILDMQRRMHMQAGILVANPVPEADEIPFSEMAQFIDAAQADADANAVLGKAVTPYILGRIAELTNGRSIATNIALVKNNARVAASIAAELAGRVRKETNTTPIPVGRA